MQQQLTRRVLYDLVWARPMTKVAAEFGISDVALKKICGKHRIPTPSRGYWAKKQAGKPVRQIHFHEASDPQREHLVIHGLQDQIAPLVRAALERERRRRQAKPQLPPAARSAPANPLPAAASPLAAIIAALRRAKPDGHGLVRPRGREGGGLAVGVACVERVAGILDRLACELAARGLALEPTEKGIVVSAPPGALTFTLTEHVEHTKHIPTLEELAAEDRLRQKHQRNARLGVDTPLQRAYPDDDTVYTGALTIQIVARQVRGLRRTWRDGRRQRLETMVTAIAEAMVDYLAGIKAEREEHEAWRRAWERQQRLQAMAEARQERETQRRGFEHRLAKIAKEVEELQALYAKLRHQATAARSDDLRRTVLWLEQRVHVLEGKLSAERISHALREKRLFSASAPLDHEEDGEEDGW